MSDTALALVSLLAVVLPSQAVTVDVPYVIKLYFCSWKSRYMLTALFVFQRRTHTKKDVISSYRIEQTLINNTLSNPLKV